MDDFICAVTCEEYYSEWYDEDDLWEDWEDEHTHLVPSTYEIYEGEGWYAEVEANVDLDAWSDY